MSLAPGSASDTAELTGQLPPGLRAVSADSNEGISTATRCSSEKQCRDTKTDVNVAKASWMDTSPTSTWTGRGAEERT